MKDIALKNFIGISATERITFFFLFFKNSISFWILPFIYVPQQNDGANLRQTVPNYCFAVKKMLDLRLLVKVMP